MGGKWLELLKEIAPRTTRVALIFNPDTHSGQFFQSLEAVGPSLGIEAVQTPFITQRRSNAPWLHLTGRPTWVLSRCPTSSLVTIAI